MNISIQMCGLINIITLILFYISAKRIRLYKRKLFFCVLLITFINICFDILSIIVINYRDTLSHGLVMFVCKLYLCAVVFQSVSALLYVLMDVVSQKMLRNITRICGVVTAIECILIFELTVKIFQEGRVVYTYGTSVITLYVTSAINILATCICTFVFRNRMNVRRKMAVRIWMLIWLIAMGIQYLNNELLVVGFAASVGMIVLFLFLENPEGQLDKQYGCLNSLALVEYLNQNIEAKKQIFLYDICLENVTELKRSDVNATEQIRTMINYLSAFNKISVFKNFDKNIIVISEDRESGDAAIHEFVMMFSRQYKNGREDVILFLDNAHEMENSEDVMRLLAFMKNNHLDSKIEYLTITKNDINDFYVRGEIRNEITNAISEGRIEVFFQPIYNTKAKKITSAEALVRIRNKDGTLMPPYLFIPISEETGQIIEIGKIVFEKTCEFLASSRAMELGIEYIEVNLSIVQAERDSLVDELLRVIRKYKLSPSAIDLEITESAFVKSMNQVVENMNQLKSVGFTFALDDFGKGESNIMYLVELPFDIIKLDMDMTKAAHVNEKAKTAVGAIRYMAAKMNLKIVAEGVEDQDELDDLMQYDIDYIQGYHFSKPLPADEFIKYIWKFNRDFEQ